MSEVIVRVKEGKIRGIRQISPIFKSEYYSFYGVPYAEPPIKELRFKDPVKVHPWPGNRNATSPRDGCIQYSMLHTRLMGSEDCLHLNIHTPTLPEEDNQLKAVVVFLHPGSLLWGSHNPNDHGSPNFVMHHDVVYVTVGHRLNIFGFLNLDLEECSGNQGLKDVIMAFQWIRTNIHVFNGDPENITAVGSSSGSMLVHLLLLSPATKGLFHRAVMMGLYAFNCLIPHNKDHTKRAFEFAHDFGFKGNDKQRLLKFLKKAPAEKLIFWIMKYQAKLDKNTIKCYLGGPFNEGIDSTILPVPPRQLISGMERVPIIFGICDREAICGFTKDEEKTIEKYFHTGYRQGEWGWPRNLTDEELDQLNDQINSFYLENLPKRATTLSQKIDIYTDAAFSDLYDTLIDCISSHYPVYIYKFQYDGEISVLNKAVSRKLSEPVKGTYHCDDVSYWADQGMPETPKTRYVVNTFTKLLCSFAKTGDPNYEGIEVKWEPTTSENPCYLEIHEKLTLIKGKLNGERFEFWEKLKKQFQH